MGAHWGLVLDPLCETAETEDIGTDAGRLEGLGGERDVG